MSRQQEKTAVCGLLSAKCSVLTAVCCRLCAVLFVAWACLIAAAPHESEPSSKRFPVTVRVDFGPAGKPAREERLMVDKGSTPKDVVSLLFPIQSGTTCCNTRELSTIDGVRSDPAMNLWWTCRLNGQSNFSPFLKEVEAEDRIEWIYVEQLQ